MLQILTELVEEPLLSYLGGRGTDGPAVFDQAHRRVLHQAISGFKLVLSFLGRLVCLSCISCAVLTLDMPDLRWHVDCTDPPAPSALQWVELGVFRCCA